MTENGGLFSFLSLPQRPAGLLKGSVLRILAPRIFRKILQSYYPGGLYPFSTILSVHLATFVPILPDATQKPRLARSSSRSSMAHPTSRVRAAKRPHLRRRRSPPRPSSTLPTRRRNGPHGAQSEKRRSRRPRPGWRPVARHAAAADMQQSSLSRRAKRPPRPAPSHIL